MIHIGDCLEVLKTLQDCSVQCCVTSPPYFGLRDYGVSGQIGLEESPQEYIDKLVQVFRQVKRVLKDDGTLWLNIGDSYNGSGKVGNNSEYAKNHTAFGKVLKKGYHEKPVRVSGIKPKDLIGIPWMLAFALREDGWYLRQDIIWAKGCSGSYKGGAVMPESVTDRCTKAHEYIFLLSKSKEYYFNTLKEDSISAGSVHVHKEGNKISAKKDDPLYATKPQRTMVTGSTRNMRDVWVVPIKPYKQAHFATFPIDLITPCIKAGSKIGDVVLDPFNGAGTTGVACKVSQREYIGVELNPEYVRMSEDRIKNTIVQGDLL